MSPLRSIIANGQDRRLGHLLLNIQRPMLHVGRMPIRLNCAQALYSRDGKRSRRIVQPGIARRHGLLVRWIGSDVLLVSADQNLLMINTIARADRCLAFMERIPRQSKARSKVSFGNIENILAPW